MATLQTDLRKALQTVDRNRVILDRAHTVAYRSVGGGDLHLHLFGADGAASGAPRPAILFFHGSLWDKGLVSQFAPQALYFAERGLLTGLVEYRMASTHQTGPMEALDDARVALRWLAQRCATLNVDRARIALAGASGGAWAAMMAALMAADPEAAAEGDPVVNALLMFEPVCDPVFKLPTVAVFPDAKSAKRLAPAKWLRRDMPDALFLHGTGDRIVPCEATAKLAKAWKKHRPETRFMPYEGAVHGFYHFGSDLRLYENTLHLAEDFLVARDYLSAQDDQVISI